MLSSCRCIEHKFSCLANKRGSIKQLQGILSLMWNLYILLVLNSSTYVQGVSGGIVNILRGGSMDYCEEISSYKHVSNFQWV